MTTQTPVHWTDIARRLLDKQILRTKAQFLGLQTYKQSMTPELISKNLLSITLTFVKFIIILREENFIQQAIPLLTPQSENITEQLHTIQLAIDPSALSKSPHPTANLSLLRKLTDVFEHLARLQSETLCYVQLRTITDKYSDILCDIIRHLAHLIDSNEIPL